MSKVVLNDVSAGYNASTINSNFAKIEEALNDKVLYRDSPTGEPNELKNDIDFNGKNAYNVGTISVSSIEIGGLSLEPGDAVTNATIQPFEFVATAGQTQFSVSPFTPTTTALLVEVNGISLPTSSVATSGSTVTIPACELGDEVIVRIFTRAVGGVSPATGDNVAFVQSGAGAVTRTVQSKLRDVVNVRDFGAVSNGSDETAKVQLAINSLPANGGDITIPAGTKFNLKSLVFPAKSNLIYRADDDLSSPGPGSDIGSGEWVNFSVNSSYPAQPTGGAVNEWRFSSNFHPAIIVDARKDVTGGNSGLGAGQTLDEPVRASLNLFDEQTDAGRLVYENYASGSNFSMMKLHTWRRVVTLNGIGTAQWVSVPSENTLITGQTSGARGFVLSVSAGATTVLWFSGKFVAGEKLIDNNETTTATVTSVSYSLTSMAPLSQGVKRGNWAIGLPADAVRDAFVVGGKIGTQKDRSPTYYVDELITAPGFVWVDSYENATPNGFEVVYDTVPAAASRRLTLRKYNSTTDMGHIGAVAAHCTVADPGTPVFRSGGFNFATVVRGGSTGRYDFTFTSALPTANYRVLLSSQFKGHLTFDLKTTSGFSVFVSNATGTDQWAPFDFDVVIVGGDI
jgi:hypothetical protein